MKFEFPSKDFMCRLKMLSAKYIFHQMLVSTQENVTLKVISHYSCQVIQPYLSLAWIYGLTQFFLILFVMMTVRINFRFTTNMHLACSVWLIVIDFESFVYTLLYDRMINYDGWLIWSCNNIMFRVKRCLGCVTNRSKYLTDLPDVQISCPFFLNF